MNKYNVIVLSLLTLILSCTQVAENETTVDFSYEIKSNLLDSVSDLKLVLLENNEDALLSNVDQVFYNNGCFIIYDDDNQLVVKYSREGEFMNRIGSQGQGPLEYISTSFIDVYNNKLCFSDYESKTLLYDIDSSNLLNAFAFLGDQVAFSGNEGYVVFNNMESESKSKFLYFFNKQLKPVKDSLDIDFSSGYQFDPLGKFFRHKDTLYCYPTFDNMVYSISDDCCTPFRAIGFGKYRMPNKTELSKIGNDAEYKEFMMNDDDYIHGFEPVINDKYIAIRYWTGKRTFMGFHNKFTKFSYYQETTQRQEDSFLYWIKGSFDDYFISPMLVADLRESESLKTNSMVQDFLDRNVDEDDDSMVLVIWRLK